jgi:alkylation response protein AidB-like acyl-CoA dehydrogenase
VIAPGALLPTVTQFVPVVRACGDSDQRARFLGAVAEGSCRATLALAEASGSFDPAHTGAHARVRGGTARLSGTKRFVMEAGEADEIAVVVRLADTDEIAVVVVPGGAVEVRPIRSIDASRTLGDVVLDGVTIDSDRILHHSTGLDGALEEATVALALETVGVCQTIFDTTLDYAKHREQFGVPIGSFQAIKHKLADMHVALESSRSALRHAIEAADGDDADLPVAASMAQAWCAEACWRATAETIQIHGGIGFTWEHDAHLFLKRATLDRVLLGDPAWHRARMARELGW